MVVQFAMAEISPVDSQHYLFALFLGGSCCCGFGLPWRVGLPVTLFSLWPLQIRSPSPSLLVWFTITVPKAAKGHGAGRAALAARIQCARVL